MLAAGPGRSFALTVGLTSPTEPFAPQHFRVLRSDALKRSSQVRTVPALSSLTKMSRLHKISDLGIKAGEG